MSANKKRVQEHIAATTRAEAAASLADDVEWIEWADGVRAEGVRTRGKEAFVRNYGEDVLRSDVIRVIEEGNVVVVEGVAHVTKPDGRKFDVRYCNLFEVEGDKIVRKTSYGALLKDG
jgi:ketosteroid isomerase-like protein